MPPKSKKQPSTPSGIEAAPMVVETAAAAAGKKRVRSNDNEGEAKPSGNLAEIQKKQRDAKRQKKNADDDATQSKAPVIIPGGGGGEATAGDIVNFKDQLFSIYANISGGGGAGNGNGSSSSSAMSAYKDNFISINPHDINIFVLLTSFAEAKKNKDGSFNLQLRIMVLGGFTKTNKVSRNTMLVHADQAGESADVFVTMHNKSAPKGKKYQLMSDYSQCIYPGCNLFVSAYENSEPPTANMVPFMPGMVMQLQPTTSEGPGGRVFWNIKKFEPNNILHESMFLTVLQKISRTSYWFTNLSQEPPDCYVNPDQDAEKADAGLDEHQRKAASELRQRQAKQREYELIAEWESQLTEEERRLCNDSPVICSWDSNNPIDLDTISVEEGCIQSHTQFSNIDVKESKGENVDLEKRWSFSVEMSTILTQWCDKRDVPVTRGRKAYIRCKLLKNAIRNIFGVYNIHEYPGIVNAHIHRIPFICMPFLQKAESAVLGYPTNAPMRHNCDVGLVYTVNNTLSDLDHYLVENAWPITYEYMSEIIIEMFGNISSECAMDGELDNTTIKSAAELKLPEKLHRFLSSVFNGVFIPMETKERVSLCKSRANHLCYLLTDVPMTPEHRAAMAKAGWKADDLARHVSNAFRDPKNSSEGRVLPDIANIKEKIPYVLRKIAIDRVNKMIMSHKALALVATQRNSIKNTTLSAKLTERVQVVEDDDDGEGEEEDGEEEEDEDVNSEDLSDTERQERRSAAAAATEEEPEAEEEEEEGAEEEQEDGEEQEEEEGDEDEE